MFRPMFTLRMTALSPVSLQTSLSTLVSQGLAKCRIMETVEVIVF